MLNERKKPDPNLIQISTKIYENFLEICNKDDVEMQNSDQVLNRFINDLKQSFPKLSAESIVRNLNIVADKILQYNTSLNSEKVKKILTNIIDLLPTKQRYELLDATIFRSLLQIASNHVLESFENSKNLNLFNIVDTIYEHTIQIEGVVNSDSMPDFLENMRTEGNPDFFYLDGAGKSLISTDLVQILNHPNGKSVIIDHHHLKKLNNPSTILMYVKIIKDLLGRGLDPIFAFTIAFKNSSEQDKHILCKLLLSYINCEDNKHINLEHLELLINFKNFKHIISQPDPDSVTPISVYNFILFWDALFTDSTFSNIPILEFEKKIEYIKNFANLTFKNFVKNPIINILETAVLNQYDDLDIETLKLELSKSDINGVINSQLKIVLRKYYPNIAISESDHDLILKTFVETINTNCESVESCLIKISQKINLEKLTSIQNETVLAIFNRLYVYRHRSNELMQFVDKAIKIKEAQVESFVKSDLFENCISEIVDIYNFAHLKASEVGDYDLMCIYCIEEFLTRIETIVQCISVADSMGGIIPLMDFDDKIKLPRSIAFAFENNPNQKQESGVFDQIENLIATSYTSSSKTFKATILSLIMASVTNHIHEYARRMMNQYRDKDFITSHVEFKFHSVVLLSLMLAFNKQDIDNYVSKTSSYFPIKKIKFDNNRFYKVSLSPSRRLKAVMYSQFDIPKDLIGMDRTIAMLKDSPDLMIVYVGKAGHVGRYNYTVALTNNDRSDVMNALLNLISIFTSIYLGDLTIDQIIANPKLVNLHSGSNFGITGFRFVGVPFGPDDMEDFVDSFIKVYELANIQSDDTVSSKKQESNTIFFIHHFIEWFNETSTNLLDPNYHSNY